MMSLYVMLQETFISFQFYCIFLVFNWVDFHKHSNIYENMLFLTMMNR